MGIDASYGRYIGICKASHLSHKAKLSPSDQKTASVWQACKPWLERFALAVGFAIFAVATCLLALPLRYQEWRASRPARILKKEYLEAFRKQFEGLAYLPSSKAVPGIDPQALDRFEKKLEVFSKKLLKLAEDPNEMRAQIVALSRDPVYLDLLTKDPNHPAAVFLQECGIQLESTQAEEAFQNYGKRRMSFRNDREQFTRAEYVDKLSQARTRMPHVQNGLVDRLLWTISHPWKAFELADSHLFPLDYNGYEDFPVFQSTSLEDQGHKITHRYTPGLTGPQSIVENVLIPAYRRKGMRWIHINHQSIFGSEKPRVDEVNRLAVANRDVLTQAVVAFEPAPWIQETVIDSFVKSDLCTLEEFFNNYERMLRGKNDECIRQYEKCQGVHIPKSWLSTEDLNAVFSRAKRMVSQLAKQFPEELKTPQGRKKWEQISRANLNSLLNFAIMKKGQFRFNNLTLTQSCKQTNDRGPFQNEMMILNDEKSRGIKELSKKTAQLRAGTLLGLSEYSNGRSPNQPKFDDFVRKMHAFEKDRFGVEKNELEHLRKTLIHS